MNTVKDICGSTAWSYRKLLKGDVKTKLILAKLKADQSAKIPSKGGGILAKLTWQDSF